MSLFSALLPWLRPAPSIDEADRRAIARAVAAVDPLLQSVPDFERRLAPALRQARDYCAELAVTLPGPIEIDARAYACDPLVHACFASPGDIDAMIGMSRELRDFLVSGPAAASDPLFALLAMRRHERATLGMAMNGEVLQRDVPQRVVYFSDHTLAAVCGEFAELHPRLQQLGVDSLVGSFAAHLSGRRRERDALRAERDMMRSAGRHDPDRDPAHRRRLEALDEELRRAAQAQDPARILDELAAWLSEPSAHLRLEPVSLSIDAMGIKAPSAGVPLRFPELIGRDRRRWILQLASIPRSAVLRALAAQRDREERAYRTLII